MTAKPEKRARVLIVSLPGMMQNVLKETFLCRSDVEVVGVAGGCLSALGMIAEAQPDLVVINSNMPEIETNQLILLLKDKYPQFRAWSWLRPHSSTTRQLEPERTMQFARIPYPMGLIRFLIA